MFGCASALSHRCRQFISTRTTRAPAVRITTVRPSNLRTVRPSSFAINCPTSGTTMSMSGGSAPMASTSVNDRLSRTASSASFAFRPRPVAHVLAAAATSDAIFFAIVSSSFSPLPCTGCAAPMCVPGAMAATSAAMVIRNPADAARLPDGPTNTATGVLADSMRDTMEWVESRRPPGVRSVNTRRAAPSRSARSIASIMNPADTGWTSASTVAEYTSGRADCDRISAGVHTTTAVASSAAHRARDLRRRPSPAIARSRMGHLPPRLYRFAGRVSAASRRAWLRAASCRRRSGRVAAPLRARRARPLRPCRRDRPARARRAPRPSRGTRGRS